MTVQPARTIAFVVTLDALMASGRLYQSRFRAISATIEGIIALAGIFLMVIGSSIGFVIAFTGVGMFIVDRTAVVARMQTKRQARSVLGTLRESTVTETGLRYRTVTASGEIPWTSMTAIRHNSETVLFLRDRLPLYFLPASSFDSAQDMAQFVEDCRGRLTPATA